MVQSSVLSFIISIIINVHKHLINTLFLGLVLGLVWGLVFGLFLGLFCGLVFGLFFSLTSGLTGSVIETKIIPNQSIWKSAKNATVLGLIATLLSCLFIGMSNGWTYKLSSGLISRFITNWIAFGLLGGGMGCLQHFCLRFALYKNGCIPWNYARFLDYCTERLFLQRVGGRYRFIHKTLQEHFAQMDLVPIEQTSIRSTQLVNKSQESTKPVSTTVDNGTKQPQTPVPNHISCTNCGHKNLVNCNFCTHCGSPLIR